MAENMALVLSRPLNCMCYLNSYSFLSQEDEDELDLSATPMALLSKVNGGDGCPVTYRNKVSVVLEGQEIVTLANFPEAFLVMFGLLYALHISYPKKLKLTFEFVQKIILGLEDGKLSPRLQTLKNNMEM